MHLYNGMNKDKDKLHALLYILAIVHYYDRLKNR